MKKIIILSILTVVLYSGYSRNAIKNADFKQEDPIIIKNKNHQKNVDPCLDAALNAQSNAFNAEYLGHQFCANSVSSGAIAISEYGGCAYAFTSIRQATVAYIQSTFVPCPSGNGVGIAYNYRSKNSLQKG